LKIKKNISKLFLINHQNFFIFRFSRLIGIHYNLNPSVENLSKIDFDNISPLIGSNKENILKFRFLNIPVGENFYDWHLRKNKLGTISWARSPKDNKVIINMYSWKGADLFRCDIPTSLDQVIGASV
jgi:hypothetical protein